MIRFTIIIATHRRPQLLARALDSLRGQSRRCEQILVVSDCLDAQTYDCCATRLEAGDQFIQRTGIPGPAASRNLALRVANGTHVLFLDDDDTFRPDFLATLERLLDPHARRQLVYTNLEVLHERHEGDKHFAYVQPIDLATVDPLSVFVKNFIPNNCVVFPRDVLEGLEFDTDLAYEDWDFLLGACARGNLRHLPILGPRVHKNADLQGEHRGEKGIDRLVDCYLRVYGRHHAPTPELANQRRALFAGHGHDLDAMLAAAREAETAAAGA